MPCRRPPRLLAFVALSLVAVACGSKKKDDAPRLHVPSPAWEDQVIYFVLTDRFANGDTSNDDQGAGEYDPGDNDKYSGGDLRGVQGKLDYIQGLGATAVWITPPVANMWWDPLVSSAGYHGYWARDLLAVDEHLGTLEDFKALSSALHRRGMYLVQDVVPNHMGNFFTFSGQPAGACGPDKYEAGLFVKNTLAKPTPAPTQAPFDQVDATDPAQRSAAIYHWTPAISDYVDTCQEVNYQISDLDDLNTENPAVREALKRSYGYWVTEVGVDAFRVDTAKFVPLDFWQDFFHSTSATAPGILATAKATGRDDFLAFGEVFETALELDDTADRKVASFLGTAAEPALPSVLQFPLYEEMKRVFASGKPTADMTYRLERFMDPALFPHPERLPTFVDNHDVQRFLAIGSPEGLTQALAFIFTLPGIPVIYQGTEQAFTVTRNAMFAGGFGSATDRFDTAAPFYERIRALAAMRRASRAFTRGTLAVLQDNPAGPGALVYRREHEGESVLVLMNTADEPVLVSGLATGLAAGTKLELLFAENGGVVPEVGAGGSVRATLAKRSVVVARATASTTPPPPPNTTITVTTPVEGQTFTGDVTLAGTASPADTRLFLVLDGYVERAAAIVVGSDGKWSVNLPVSLFPTGIAEHTVIVNAPDVKVSTPALRFTSDVVFDGEVYAFTDPAGDDRGPAGTYTYPQDPTFGHEMDVTGVTVEVGATTLNLKLQMADWSTTWNPSYGFDHVTFNVYFSLPGQPGGTALPSAGGATQALNASTPAGFAWSLAQFGFGWTNAMYRYDAATPGVFGPPTTAPTIRTNAAAKTVSFTYDRTKYGLASWSGVKIYVTTWDFDGINASFRKLTAAGAPYDFGGGATDCAAAAGCSDPKIMDDVPVITIP